MKAADLARARQSASDVEQWVKEMADEIERLQGEVEDLKKENAEQARRIEQFEDDAGEPLK